MAVLPHIRAKPGRTPFQRHLPRQPALYQRVQAIIDRRHRNVRHVPLRPDKHLLRRRVIAFPQEHSIDMLSLRGKSKTSPREPFVQPAIAIHAHCSIHLAVNLASLLHLSIFGTILIRLPAVVPAAGFGFQASDLKWVGGAPEHARPPLWPFLPGLPLFLRISASHCVPSLIALRKRLGTVSITPVCGAQAAFRAAISACAQSC
jgi:hypothetical protein